MLPRPPVVTILGHVDHGKTTLLDFIRKSNITVKEHGGITQKIGGYEVKTNIKGYPTNKITFIDTPGHEAFSFLRARGANVADLAILIIDGKDSVMPQTAESISHIKNAKLPFIVAINKIDLPEANLDKVKNDLLKYEVVAEDKGGSVLTLPISAKTGKGVQELLEAILLITADLNLKYNPNSAPSGYIIETKKDRRGILASIILKDGHIKVGDDIFAGELKTRVRSIYNDYGEQITEVYPSTPVEVLGFEELPQTGAIVSNIPSVTKKEEVKVSPKTPFDLAFYLTPGKKEKQLSLIIKTDSQGSLEAVTNSLAKNTNIVILLAAVGSIHKSDVFLAKTSKAIVIGFNSNLDPDIKDVAKQEKVIIKTYNIIYDLLDELTEVSDLMREKEETEKNLKGEAKVLANFIIEKEKVIGVKVIKGKINLADELQIFRQNNLFGKTKLVSLQIRAKKVSEVKKDQEAGLILSPPLDIRIGDVVKSIL